MSILKPERVQILVVDSYSGWRDAVAVALRDLGYGVRSFRGAAEALACGRALGEPLDLLLTETELHDMDGLELGRRLRLAHPRMRVVFMSYAIEEAGEALLGKPFSLAALERVVRRALARPPRRSITEVFEGVPTT